MSTRNNSLAPPTPVCLATPTTLRRRLSDPPSPKRKEYMSPKRMNVATAILIAPTWFHSLRLHYLPLRGFAPSATSSLSQSSLRRGMVILSRFLHRRGMNLAVGRAWMNGQIALGHFLPPILKYSSNQYAQSPCEQGSCGPHPTWVKTSFFDLNRGP